MDFSTAVKRGIENIGNVEGRASRAEFWWFALAVWVIEFVLLNMITFIFSGILWWMLYVVVWAIGFLAIVSAAVRRLHDVGQSGWMAILWVIPCVFLIPLYFSVQPSQADNEYGPPSTA